MESMFDGLVLSTCRIVASDNSGSSSVGTGFFYSFPAPEGEGLVLVTNRHVLAGMTAAQITLTRLDDSGVPAAGGHMNANLLDMHNRVYFHPDPDVDLACLKILDAFEHFHNKGKKASFRAIEPALIPPDDADLSPIEEILMIGYPQGLYDETHNRPLVRRGITATDLRLDFNSSPIFLIDAACFPGSSGSPVFIANHGAFPRAGGTTIGTRLLFVGVLFAGPQFQADGSVEAVPIPTTATLKTRMMIPMNLGFCVKAREVRRMTEALTEWIQREARSS